MGLTQTSAGEYMGELSFFPQLNPKFIVKKAIITNPSLASHSTGDVSSKTWKSLNNVAMSRQGAVVPRAVKARQKKKKSV